MAIDSYKTNPEENVSINGIDIAEGCPPGNINNAMRQMMADVKDFRDETSSALDAIRPTFNENKTFYISPGGSASNDGLSADTPFAALDDVLIWLNKHDFISADFVVHVHFMPGTYAAMTINGQCLKNRPASFRFYAYDAADKPVIRQLYLLNAPAVVIENINFQPVPSEGSSYGIYGRQYGRVTVKSCNFTLQNGCAAIRMDNHCMAELRGNTTITAAPGQTAGLAIGCSCFGCCFNSGTLTVNGAYRYVFDARYSSVMDLNSNNSSLVKLSISSSYAVCCSYNSFINITNVSGTNAGGSCAVHTNSIIHVNGAGANYIPGNNPWVVTQSGGIYA